MISILHFGSKGHASALLKPAFYFSFDFSVGKWRQSIRARHEEWDKPIIFVCCAVGNSPA